MFNVSVCVSVVSVSLDEEGSHSSSSEDEADHATTSSQVSPSSSTTASSPFDMPCPYPPSSSPHSPCSYLPSSPSSTGLQISSPCSSHDVDSVCSSGHVSPLLGPRSQCSGASSPDCDQERGVCSLHQCVHDRCVGISLYIFLFYSSTWKTYILSLCLFKFLDRVAFAAIQRSHTIAKSPLEGEMSKTTNQSWCFSAICTYFKRKIKQCFPNCGLHTSSGS